MYPYLVFIFRTHIYSNNNALIHSWTFVCVLERLTFTMDLLLLSVSCLCLEHTSQGWSWVLLVWVPVLVTSAETPFLLRGTSALLIRNSRIDPVWKIFANISVYFMLLLLEIFISDFLPFVRWICTSSFLEAPFKTIYIGSHLSVTFIILIYFNLLQIFKGTSTKNNTKYVFLCNSIHGCVLV